MSFVSLEELIKVLRISKKNFNRMWLNSPCFNIRELRDIVFKQWSEFATGVFMHLAPNLSESDRYRLVNALYSIEDLLGDLYE